MEQPQQQHLIHGLLNGKERIDALRKEIRDKKNLQEKEELQLKASIDMTRMELSSISVRFYYEKQAKKVDKTQQQDLLRESWDCKHRMNAVKKELYGKKSEYKKNLLELRVELRRSIDVAQGKKVEEIREKPISKEKLQQLTDDICSVCFENHTMCEVVQTCCGHQIGKECYQMWVNHCKRYSRTRKTSVTCPVCRRVNPKYFVFCERKTKNNTEVVA